MAPFYGWGSTTSRLQPLRGGSLLFTTQFPEIPGKDERLSRPWSHPVVLNTGPLDWESTALTTRPHHKNMTIHTFSSLYAYKGFMKFHWNLKIKRKGHHTEVI